MKIKSFTLTAFLLVSTLAHASELIILNNGQITIATERTKLPYNVLFVDYKTGALCFRGEPLKVEGIINRMIDNHSITTTKLETFEVSDVRNEIRFSFKDDNESHNDGSRPHFRYIKKCK